MDSKLLLTVGEAAVRLNVGRSHLYKLLLDGDVRSIKVGRARRIPVAALEEFIEVKLEQGTDGGE